MINVGKSHVSKNILYILEHCYSQLAVIWVNVSSMIMYTHMFIGVISMYGSCYRRVNMRGHLYGYLRYRRLPQLTRCEVCDDGTLQRNE